MNLIFVSDRCCDHSPSSGYDQICSIFPEAGWLSGRELEAGRLSWYREPSPEHTSSSSRLILHVFYGDCSGSGLHELLREHFPNALIVSTVHQPISRLEHDPAGWRSLFLADALITVSEIQARQLADVELHAPIYAIPHGVWAHVFALQCELHLSRVTRSCSLETTTVIGPRCRNSLSGYPPKASNLAYSGRLPRSILM